jgi:hypothetical protein
MAFPYRSASPLDLENRFLQLGIAIAREEFRPERLPQPGRRSRAPLFTLPPPDLDLATVFPRCSAPSIELEK